MKTRIGKIARLSRETREQLNLRLLNGELGTTLLHWLNELPETKNLVNSVFAGKPISKQNLSEWRHGGYQDWLRHQHRQERFRQMSEQGAELEDNEGSGDLFENFSRVVLAEMAEDIDDLHKLRNREERWQRLREIARDLARLQHGYNHSRKIQLAWDKWNSKFSCDDNRSASSQPEQKLPTQTPSSLKETAAVKPGQTESKQKNLSPADPFRRIHHRNCSRDCICKDCHSDGSPYPYAQAVKDYEETRKPEYWALENPRPFMVMNVACDCYCDCDVAASRASAANLLTATLK